MDNSSPTFIRMSGYYVMEPLLFMHLWNQSSSMGVLVKQVQQRWSKFSAENVLITDKNGTIKEPKINPSSFSNRVKTFREAGAFMKKLPKASVHRYDWNEIILQSKQYVEATGAPIKNNPPLVDSSKGFFSR
jgi:hypothetical protein